MNSKIFRPARQERNVTAMSKSSSNISLLRSWVIGLMDATINIRLLWSYAWGHNMNVDLYGVWLRLELLFSVSPCLWLIEFCNLLLSFVRPFRRGLWQCAVTT